MKEIEDTKAKRTQKDYTLGFKLALVDLVEKGDMTYKQAQDHYGIQGRSTVLVWLRKHGKLDWTNPTTNKTPMQKTETPAQKIHRLEKELADERDRNLILNKMVDVFDNQYGANLRKKHLTAFYGNLKKTTK